MTSRLLTLAYRIIDSSIDHCRLQAIASHTWRYARGVGSDSSLTSSLSGWSHPHYTNWLTSSILRHVMLVVVPSWEFIDQSESGWVQLTRVSNRKEMVLRQDRKVAEKCDWVNLCGERIPMPESTNRDSMFVKGGPGVWQMMYHSIGRCSWGAAYISEACWTQSGTEKWKWWKF